MVVKSGFIIKGAHGSKNVIRKGKSFEWVGERVQSVEN